MPCSCADWKSALAYLTEILFEFILIQLNVFE